MANTLEPPHDVFGTFGESIDDLYGGLTGLGSSHHYTPAAIDFTFAPNPFAGADTVPMLPSDYPSYLPASPPGSAYLQSPSRERPGLDYQYIDDAKFRLPGAYRKLYDTSDPCKSSAKQTSMMLWDLAESKAGLKSARKIYEDALIKGGADSAKEEADSAKEDADSAEEDADSAEEEEAENEAGSAEEKAAPEEVGDSARGGAQKRKREASKETEERGVETCTTRWTSPVMDTPTPSRKKRYGGDKMKF